METVCIVLSRRLFGWPVNRSVVYNNSVLGEVVGERAIGRFILLIVHPVID